MKKTTTIVTTIVLLFIIFGSFYGVHRLFYHPEVESQKETVTVIDKTGVSVEVKVSVNRIVNIAPGAVEIICALGCGDKIVGRDAYSTFPPSVLEIPVVAESSFSPNMERILELNPDLIIADEGLSDENREKFESAGVPVIVEMLMEPRLKTAIRNFGLILGEEARAEEYINYTVTYQNLVNERIATLTQSQKPKVYFEWYQAWYTSSIGDSWDVLIVAAGGRNIAPENLNVSNPILSSEYVAEQNPDIIVRMLTRMDGEDMAVFQTLRNELLSRAALSVTSAVNEGKVFIIHNTLLVLRPAIGLLYLAKWFHPDLFEDIEPTAIHEQMIQKFFGVQLEDVYAYPSAIGSLTQSQNYTEKGDNYSHLEELSAISPALPVRELVLLPQNNFRQGIKEVKI
ncbi:ABC transporter substrate-binding protein [Candidatus Bathyarchaeota archaeon A05DMB-2]|jgi:iron complex transport system substrate-binding protein|nr:ABC transporter substrate-binding protein [Candidatus Bathyarchaeota archaeon A05DMB-2]